MTPIRHGKYRFSPDSIVDLRKKLNMSQRKMAEELNVPFNTLYRWEKGKIAPDATKLAAIFSLAKEHGIAPDFFRLQTKEEKKSMGRYRLIVMWDYQNFGVSDNNVEEASHWVKNTLEKKFTSTTYHRYKAFSSPYQSRSTDVLQSLGWRGWEDTQNMDEEIYDQCMSDCGQDPKATILVLITRDGDFADLIEELQVKGVRVYLLAPDNASQDLFEAVGRKRIIPWAREIWLSGYTMGGRTLGWR